MALGVNKVVAQDVNVLTVVDGFAGSTYALGEPKKAGGEDKRTSSNSKEVYEMLKMLLDGSYHSTMERLNNTTAGKL